MKTFNNDNQRQDGSYIVFDAEFLYDRPLYEIYARRDQRAAEIRWPFRRIAAASVMAVEVRGGIMSVSDMQSFSGPEEDRTLIGLFAFFTERPFHQLVTWAGLSADLPVVRLAAAEHGLKLPAQLRQERSRLVHLDLAVAMKGGATFVHLSEVAARCRVPCKMGGSAAMVPKLARMQQWRLIEHIAEADIITTAMVLAYYLVAEDKLLSARAAAIAIIRFVRPIRARASYATVLGNVADRLKREIDEELATWIRRAS